jgi:tRNA(Ile)-lysidine synthase
VEARDVPSLAEERGLAIEEAARRARYAFLAEVAQRAGAGRIAVAHNADDQSETILMHWLRGAGLAGLRGMLPAVRMAELRLIVGPGEGGDLWLIRPLLDVERADIERYCDRHNLEPRFDRSNLDTTLYRNKLRHELLPYLEQTYKPGFAEILRRSARVIRDEYDLLTALRDRAWQDVVRDASERAVVFDLAAWRALHVALQRATLREAVRRLRWDLRDVNYQHIEQAVRVASEGDAGSQATLPRRVMLTVGYEAIFVADDTFVPRADFPALYVPRLLLVVPGTSFLQHGGQVSIDIVPRADLPSDWAQNDDPWLAFLDLDAIGSRLWLRQRQDGDRFCPLGMGGRAKLVSDLLINEKVPAWWRDWVPLLVNDKDEIMWVCGWRVDERARLRDDTVRVAIIRLRASR